MQRSDTTGSGVIAGSLLDRRIELPAVVADQSRKVLTYWRDRRFSAEETQAAFGLFLRKLGEGKSPRTAFLEVNSELR